jgi:hypothetical protein
MTRWFFNCDVTRVGATGPDPKVLVALSDRNGTFRDRGFWVSDSTKEELLATALAAASTGSRVEALLDDNVAESSVLHALYLAVLPWIPPEPAPLAVGDPSGYFALAPRVVYRADDGHIHEFSIDEATGSWQQFDMNDATGAPLAVGDPSGYFGVVPRVIYRADDGHIHEFSIDQATGSWQQFDMNDATLNSRK